MRRYIYIGMMGLIVWLCASCSSGSGEESPRHTVTQIPVYLSIPADDGMGMRALGDPGTYEVFELPRYLYLYIIAYKNGDGSPTMLTFEGGTNMQELDENLWEKTVNVQNGYPVPGDSVYRYTGTVSLEIDEEDLDRSRNAKAYAVLSAKRLDSDLENKTATPTEEAVKDFSFTIAEKDGGYTYLRDIYTTPCNMNTAGKDMGSEGGTYYGTLQNFNSTVPSVNLMLYHVAAKMDVTWNVTAERQPGLKVTFVQFEKLFNSDYGKAYLFKPTQNYCTKSVTSLPTGYAVTLCDGDVGMQYYGRGYTYAIPFRLGNGKYFIPMRMRKEGGLKDYVPVFTVASTSDIFVPWIRLNLSLNNIPDGSDTPVEVPM
ncbi:MAG: hypothetical protein IJ190_10680 [Prevotella sp.]|nr:hypothetical protein [Prevotella sp.]